jgi:hypothetical protein
MRANTSASQACGSPSLSLQIEINVSMTAARSPPRSEPANNHDLRLCTPLHKRKAWLFAGSDRGAERAAVMNTLIMTARLNDIDPKAWLADLFARIADHPQTRLHELLP